MQDHEIIELYFARNEQAISETDRKYGATCMRLSMNILNSRPDAEECVNDTYLSVWNSIPPQRPSYFKAFICRIARNVSLKRYRYLHSQCRDAHLTVMLDELDQCAALPEGNTAGLGEVISDFLEEQEQINRLLFMGRYFHGCTVKDLARRCGMTVNAVSVRLHRVGDELRDYQEERGYSL